MCLLLFFSNLVYMTWFKKRPKHWTQLEKNRGWISDLAQYNTEVAHGIVHTDEWKIQMAALQAHFNRLSAEWPPGQVKNLGRRA